MPDIDENNLELKEYLPKFQDGLEYQDYVAAILFRYGIILNGFSSRIYQRELGENILGAEIKHDHKFRGTENLYIECAEKTTKNDANWRESGIHRKDKAWLYIIGDYDAFYIFAIKHLLKIEEKYEKKENETSKGFVLPLEDAEEWCIRKIKVAASLKAQYYLRKRVPHAPNVPEVAQQEDEKQEVQESIPETPAEEPDGL